MSETEESTDYWASIEKQFQEEKLKQIVNQNRENTQLSDILHLLKESLPETTIQKVRDTVNERTLHSGDDQLVEAEVQNQLNYVLTPYARRIRKERLSMKSLEENIDRQSRVKRQAKYASELLSKMLPHIEKLRTSDRFNLIPLRETFNILGSLINSYNKTAETLHLFGHRTPTIQPIPTHPHELFDWFLKLQDGQILDHQWLESARSQLQAI